MKIDTKALRTIIEAEFPFQAAFHDASGNHEQAEKVRKAQRLVQEQLKNVEMVATMFPEVCSD